MPRFTIAAVAALVALFLAPSALATEPEALDGKLTVVWIDANAGMTAPADAEYWLHQRGSGRVRLEVPAALAGPLLAMDRKSIKVRGRSRPAQAAAAPGRMYPVFQVESLAAGGDAGSQTAQGAQGAWPEGSTLGRHPWVNLLCAFPDGTGEKRDPAFFASMFSSTRPGLDYYWREQSNGQYYIADTRTVGWYTLPQPYASYVRDGNLDFGLLLEDCTALADADVYFPDYSGVNLVVNGSLGCCAWGGGGYIARDGVEQIYGTTWMPDWAWTNHTVFGHEMGHGLGLPHSSGNQQPYRDLWDVMGDLWYNCQLNTDSVIGCLGQHTISHHKDKLGWIPAAARHTLAPGTSAAVRLEKLERPAAGLTQMVKIPIHGSLSHFYTVETRRKYGYDARLPGASVVIHEVNTSYPEPANVVDGDDNFDPYDAGTRWLPGETFTDHRGITVAVNSTDGASGFNVTVTSTEQPLFADGFESGDLSRWTGKFDGGDVAVSSVAAMAGTHGLSVLMDDNNQAHVTDHTPVGVSGYLARFRFNPNGITMAPNESFTIFGAYSDTAYIVRVELAHAGGVSSEYMIRAVTRYDDGSPLVTPWVFIVNNYPYEIGVEWQGASAPGANDGSIRFTINDVPYADYGNLDNDTMRVERSLMGAVTGVDNGTRGTMYFDEFSSLKW
jgi:M6 family metalloprotease-like protein